MAAKVVLAALAAKAETVALVVKVVLKDQVLDLADLAELEDQVVLEDLEG